MTSFLSLSCSHQIEQTGSGNFIDVGSSFSANKAETAGTRLDYAAIEFLRNKSQPSWSEVIRPRLNRLQSVEKPSGRLSVGLCRTD